MLFQVTEMALIRCLAFFNQKLMLDIMSLCALKPQYHHHHQARTWRRLLIRCNYLIISQNKYKKSTIRG